LLLPLLSFAHAMVLLRIGSG
jgi:hypothetical protein